MNILKLYRKRAKEINMEYTIGGYGGRPDDIIINYTIFGSKELATYFDEHIIHHSQKIDFLNGEYKISFTMNDSFEIVRLLATRIDQITRIEPEEINHKVREIFAKGLKTA